MLKILFKSIGLFLAVLTLTFCTTKSYPEFEITEYDKVVGNCDTSICIDIHLKYHLMKDQYEAAETFNKLIEQRIFAKMGFEDEGSSKTKEERIERLIKDFEAFKTEFPDAQTGGYHQDTKTEITYQGDGVISVLIDSEVYAGGAHGMHFREFLNVDPQSGKQIDLLELIDNKDGFYSLIEEKLRLELGMEPGDEWSDYTLVDEFVFPGNIGLTDAGMLLIYNEYEVVPYAEGLIEIELSKEELDSYVEF
jgi:hypothetical protein